MRFIDFHFHELPFDLVTEKECLEDISIEHKDCNIDGDTIVNNPKLHIERIICYDHHLDWFIKVKPYSKERCRLVKIQLMA